MSRPSQVIVLAEDRRHQSFVRRYLRRLGHSEHDVRFEDLPSGRGCGEQWVRERYAKAVQDYRARSSRARTSLVVAIDADGGDRDRRLQQLQQTLNDAELPPRTDQERIAHVVPKRNIETWVLCLDGRLVDEGTDYRHEDGIEERISPAAQVFYTWTRPGAAIPDFCVPSLRATIPEVRRLEQ